MILVAGPGIKPVPPAVEERSFNHWIGKSHVDVFSYILSPLVVCKLPGVSGVDEPGFEPQMCHLLLKHPASSSLT